MGIDLSYKVVEKGYKIPREEDFENEKDYDTEYDKHLYGFNHVSYCRNSWDGPVSSKIMYSKKDIKTFLKNYLSSSESKNFDKTLKAYVDVLTCMISNEFVIVHYS